MDLAGGSDPCTPDGQDHYINFRVFTKTVERSGRSMENETRQRSVSSTDRVRDTETDN